MRVLFLSPRQMWPLRSGARLRAYHFAKALSLHSELTYLYFADPYSPPLTRSDLPFCQELIALPRPAGYSPAKILQGLLGRWPLPVLNYSSQEMQARIEAIATTRNFDLVHVDSSLHLNRYLDCIGPDVKVCFDWHNIESEAMERFASISRPPRNWYARITAAKMRRLEQAILRDATGHIVCSHREREYLLRLAPLSRVAVVENGVDCAAFSPSSGPPEKRLLYVGLMDYMPNVDAVTFFAHNLWPRIRESFPDLQFTIVGANPTEAVRSLGSLPGITVTGTVPEVSPYYKGALAVVVPLRSGGGTRLKILEAMAARVPVISTALGAEGIEATPGVHFLLADPQNPEQWIQHLGALSGFNARREALIQESLRLVETRYDWNILGHKLRQTYEDWSR